MQLIDLKAQQARIKDKIDANIQMVLQHGKYIMGPEVGELEKKLAEYIGTKNAVACSSGTDALMLSLMAYDVGPGDAIFTTPFSFIASAEVISILGATPVFVDIVPETFNIDPVKIEKAIIALNSNDPGRYTLPMPHSPTSSLKPKGIVAVDLFGLPADYERINAIACDYGLFVISDSAQSFGAVYNGKQACSLADIACVSFFPAKPLGCYGDGGMCFTDDDHLAETMSSIRLHGKGSHKYDNTRVGINGRLDTLQAAILLAKFDIFPEEMKLRQKVAQRYTGLLSPSTSKSALLIPQTPPNMQSAWAQYSILAMDEKHRFKLQKTLKQQGIPTAIYYPKPLHLQIAFAFLGYGEGDFPISEDYSKRIFSIPMHPYLEMTDQERIAEVISKC